MEELRPEQPIYGNEDWQQALDDERRYQDAAEVRRLTRLAYSDPVEAGKQAKSAGLYLEMLDHMTRAARFFTFRSKHGS